MASLIRFDFYLREIAITAKQKRHLQSGKRGFMTLFALRMKPEWKVEHVSAHGESVLILT